jgi:hypothetical protein
MDSEVVLTADVQLTDRRSTVHVRQGRYSTVLVWDNGALLAKVNSNAEPLLLSAEQYEQFLTASRAKPPASATMPRLPTMPRFSLTPRLPSMPRLPMTPRVPMMPRVQWQPKLGTGGAMAAKFVLPFLLFESFLIRLLSLGIEAACAGCDALNLSQWSLRDAET